MEGFWTIITIIGSTIVATGTVLGIYYSHRSKINDRIKDLESKVEHHQKFISILEKKALAALEEEFGKDNGTNDKRKHK